MSDDDFHAAAMKIRRAICELKAACLEQPNEGRVFEGLTIAKNACELLASFALDVRPAEEKLCFSDDCDANSPAGRFNEALRAVASKELTWPAVVSIQKDHGLTFPRSKKNDSPLEAHLLKVGVGTSSFAVPNSANGNKGTSAKDLPGWVALQVKEIVEHIAIFRSSNASEQSTISDDPAFRWMASALSLLTLDDSSLDDWVGVIVEKADAEGGLSTNSTAGWSPLVDILKEPFEGASDRADFRRFAANKIKGALKKFTQKNRPTI